MPNDDQGSPSSEGQADTGLTVDQVVDIVSDVVNKAITARSKAQESKFDKTLSDMKSMFEQKFTALTTQQTSQKDTPSGNEPKVEDHPLYKGMQKQIAELNDRLEQSEREKQSERERARDVSMRQRVSDELVKLGVDPTRTRHAMALLVDAEKRVKVDEDGELVFRDLDNQEVDFSTGLKSWTKSDDAKVFLPARGVTGSGSRPATKKSSSMQSVNPDAVVEEVGSMLFDTLKNNGF